MTPHLSLCVLLQYRLPFWCRSWAPAEKRAQLPRVSRWDRPLTDVVPSGSPRIHSHNHSMLELEGEGGSAMGHLNLNISSSVPTQRLEEFSGLNREKRQRKGQ